MESSSPASREDLAEAGSDDARNDNIQASEQITEKKLEINSGDSCNATKSKSQNQLENTGNEVHEVADDTDIRFKLPNSSLGIPQPSVCN